MRRMCIALLLCMACGKNNQPPPPTSGSPTAKPETGPRTHRRIEQGGITEQARRMYAMVCVACHGADGKGDGPGAATLNPKPRDYTDPAWQASVTDEQIKETILKGGQGVGKSPMMPGQPQLANQPETLDGLVKLIRSFGKK